MKINFHTFRMGDVEDPEIFAAQPIYEWQQTTHGQWVMENAYDLKFYTAPDHDSFGYKITIRGEIRDPRKLTEYFLRFGGDACRD